MDNTNEFVTEVTENVEPTTEEVVEKVYTEDEFKSKLTEGIDKGVRRREAKIRKEYERKYGNLESVLKAGTGKETVEEMTDTFAQFYKSKGIDIPKEPEYSNKDIEVLARVEADEIIKSGFDEVTEEADRLANIGAERMTAREKALFVKLTDHIKNTETGRELAKIGVTEDVYGSDDFKSFAKKFDSRTPITEIYEIYNKTQPKKEFKTMGSIKNTTVDKGVKDFYSREEALKFTKADFDKNPALFEAVNKSMQKW